MRCRCAPGVDAPETWGTTPMVTRAMGPAAEAMWRQVEILGGDWISLGDLWRAAGRPEGRHPEDWLDLAAPLVAGIARYFDNLTPMGDRARPAGGRMLRQWDGEDGEPWCRGDLMAPSLIAGAYAEYLDS